MEARGQGAHWGSSCRLVSWRRNGSDVGKQHSSIHVFPISHTWYRWKWAIPKSDENAWDILSSWGFWSKTKPQTPLHRLLSPSQSSFPKGNNTCPKAPPATATSLNLQLPGADGKSQKRSDFSRERWVKWMQNSSTHGMKTPVWEGRWGKLGRR